MRRRYGMNVGVRNSEVFPMSSPSTAALQTSIAATPALAAATKRMLDLSRTAHIHR